MAATAARLAPRKIGLFDGFSLRLAASIVLILGASWFVVDRAVVTDAEMLDTLASTPFEQGLPEGVVLSGIQQDADGDAVSFYFQDEMATDTGFAKNNTEAFIAYLVHPSEEAAEQWLRENQRGFVRAARLAGSDACGGLLCPDARLYDPVRIGLRGACADWGGFGSVDCVYLRDNMTIDLSVRFAISRDGGSTYYEELSRAAIGHLREVGG